MCQKAGAAYNMIKVDKVQAVFMERIYTNVENWRSLVKVYRTLVTKKAAKEKCNYSNYVGRL